MGNERMRRGKHAAVHQKPRKRKEGQRTREDFEANKVDSLLKRGEGSQMKAEKVH